VFFCNLLPVVSAGRGHYTAIVNTDTRAGYGARLITPYINTTGKCLELFYWIREEASDRAKTHLSVSVISEELTTQEELRTVSDLTTHYPRLFLRLPNGTYRVAIDGRRTGNEQFCAISLDDITVMDCTKFGKTIVAVNRKSTDNNTLSSTMFKACGIVLVGHQIIIIKPQFIRRSNMATRVTKGAVQWSLLILCETASEERTCVLSMLLKVHNVGAGQLIFFDKFGNAIRLHANNDTR